jgi:hypothetical protein
MTAAELYAAYQTGYHGVAPYDSLSPTEQGKWQAVADYLDSLDPKLYNGSGKRK